MSVETRKPAEYQRILRETELGSKKRGTRMAQLINKMRGMAKEVWFDKRVKVTSTTQVRQGVVIGVDVMWHVGLMTTLQVKLDEGGHTLCAARHADLL